MTLDLLLTLPDGETHAYVARAVSGYHRPLNGEAANLTLTLDRDSETDADWFAPPLGASAILRLDGDELLIGVLTGVALDRTATQLRLEG